MGAAIGNGPNVGEQGALMAAVIGALRVDLGLNSAEFQAGLDRARAGLGSFARTAGAGLAVVAASAAAAGVALGVAVRRSIDNADTMGELAEKIGVSVEALTSLGYAAKMSGTDTETLATGLRKLSQNMLAVAQGGTGPVATAFKALGINIRDANGALRSSDDVLIELAAKFSQLEDGATKTALAMQLFGKTGAELVPFLNQGKDGIAALQAEADRLGITLSNETAAAAGQFNDAMDRMQAGMEGMVNRIAQAALPAITSLVETLTSPDFQSAMKDFAIACITIADGIAQVFIGAHKAFQDFMAYISRRDGDIATLPEGGNKAVFPEEYGAAEGDIRRQMEWRYRWGASGPDASSLYEGFGVNADGTIKLQETKTAVDDLIASFDGLFTGGAAGAKAFNAIMAEGRAVFEATRTPAEAYALEVERLSALLQKGAIDQDTYNRAVTQAQDAFAAAESAGSQMANSIGSTLANIFGSVIDKSKTASQAVMDLVKSLGRMALEKGFQALVGGLLGGFTGGGGGGIGSLLGGLFGFANGGEFRVGGAGGVDSQLVAFKASPNETVSVTKPGQERSGVMDVRVSLDNDLLRAVVKDESGRIVGQAAPAIVGMARKGAADDTPSALGRYQSQQGGEYRS